jgi:secreted Zn-dependent insulinase-like peptidase
MNKELDKVISLIFDRIERLDDVKFKKYINVLRNKFDTPISNLIEKSLLAWREIYENTLNFEFRASVIEELGNLNHSDLQEFFNKNFIGQPKKLSVRFYAIKNKKYFNLNKSKEESYGTLNNKLRSYIYDSNDFLSKAKSIH